MSRCSEPLLWFCGSCSNPFELGEWQDHGRSCPACHGKSGVWRCGKCHGEFGQPSLGSEHPCLDKQSSSSHGTELARHSKEVRRLSSHSGSSLPLSEMNNYIERELEKARRAEWDKIWEEYFQAKELKKKLELRKE